MQAIQPTTKLFARHVDATFDADAFIGMFHGWIQHQRFADELLLIDVTDYSHVHHGPGVMLVAHECMLSMDADLGRVGLLYRARRGQPREAAASLRRAIELTARAAAMIEADSQGKVSFCSDQLEVGFDDRLRLPNTGETFAALDPHLKAIASDLFGDSAEVRHVADPKSCFRAQLSGSPALESVADFASRLPPA